jgi:hypothetical protein
MKRGAEKLDFTVFLQVRPEKPAAWWPKAANGWVTVARDGALGGWSSDLDADSMMTLAQARKAMEGWLEDHDDPKAPWHYRFLHVEPMGLAPTTKPRKRAKRTK